MCPALHHHLGELLPVSAQIGVVLVGLCVNDDYGPAHVAPAHGRRQSRRPHGYLRQDPRALDESNSPDVVEQDQ